MRSIAGAREPTNGQAMVWGLSWRAALVPWGVRLGMPVLDVGEVAERAEIGTGEEADVDFMESAVGLVWRVLVMWWLLLLLLGLASLGGG